MFEVETTATSLYKIDEEKLFAEFQDEWLDFMDGDDSEATEDDRQEWLREAIYENAHDLDYFGTEIYDDFEVDFRF